MDVEYDSRNSGIRICAGRCAINPPAVRSILPYTIKTHGVVLAGRSEAGEWLAAIKDAITKSCVAPLESGAMT